MFDKEAFNNDYPWFGDNQTNKNALNDVCNVLKRGYDSLSAKLVVLRYNLDKASENVLMGAIQ